MKNDDKTTRLVKKVMKFLHIKVENKTEKLFIQIFKFGIVGGIAFLIDYAILFCCKEFIGFNVLLSAAIAFTVSVIYNYIASVKWVFDVNRDKSAKNNFIIFIILSIVGLIITEIIMWIGSDIMGINYLITKIIATAIVMIFNFVTRKKFLE